MTNRIPVKGLEAQGIATGAEILWNLTTAPLVEHAVRRGEGLLAKDGPLVVRTGKHTGRSAQDKFTVKDDLTENVIWWNNGNKPMICTKLPDNPLGNDCSPSSSTQTGAVEVRCTELIPGVINPACLNERSSGVQISPHNVTYGYSGGNGLTPDALNRLRSAAIANGTYYTSCPASILTMCSTLSCPRSACMP